MSPRTDAPRSCSDILAITHDRVGAYAGITRIFGMAALSLSLLFTRVSNGLTSTALIDTNPMGSVN
ncbi:MAG: hypothetical protein WA364_21260 [Candidatus Nitrosopolaris sp.]